MSIKIKEMPENERPRERLINKGARSLSDAELMAIVLKVGTRDMSVKDLATFILKEYGGVQGLKNITYEELINIKGIGEAKACQIMAAIELSKRMNARYDKIVGVQITSGEVVYDYYKNVVDDYQEGFYCLYLDSHKRVIKEKMIFKGTADRSTVHPRDIFKEAYLCNAVGLVCVHNHPSGDVTPSRQDITTTSTIKKASEIMAIELVDHVIVGGDNYYSFYEKGKI